MLQTLSWLTSTATTANISTEVSSFIMVSDFNSHSQSWVYQHMDRRGEEVGNWQDANHLLLINSPSDQLTFYYRPWHTASTPDIALCTENLHRGIRREVGEKLGGSDDRPVLLKLNLGARTETTFPGWNYKKANWTLFKHSTSTLSKDITVQGRVHHHGGKRLQLLYAQNCPGKHTKRSKKKLETVLESRTTRPPEFTVSSQKSS